MKLDLLDFDTSAVNGVVEVNPLVFGGIVRVDIMHRVMVWQMAKRRAGTHSTKEIAAVSGSTRKIYKQKGTGGARHGSIRAPQFRGGAVIFGPHPRSHVISLNKKIRKLGLISALSLKKQENSIILLEQIKSESYKSSFIVKKMKNLNVEKALIVDDGFDENFRNAVSNIPKIDIIPVIGLNVVDILKHDQLIITVAALKKIEERLL